MRSILSLFRCVAFDCKFHKFNLVAPLFYYSEMEFPDADILYIHQEFHLIDSTAIEGDPKVRLGCPLAYY